MAPLNPQSVLTGTNMKMPVIGIGTFTATEDQIMTCLDAALQAGYRHIDTAAVYGNEGAIGKVLKKWFDSGKLKREDIFITTKCSLSHFRPEHIEKSLDESLEKLQLEYVDLFLAHFPVGLPFDTPLIRDDGEGVKADMNTDIIANWKTMEQMVDKGKARAIGLSNFNQSQVKRILDIARIKPANNQVELYVYLQQKQLVTFCKNNGVTICAYGPIGAPGMQDFHINALGDKKENLNYQYPMKDPVVLKIGEKYGKTPAQILLRFLLQTGVAVIPKSSKPERVRENINVFDFELSPEEYNQMAALDKGEAGRLFGGNVKFFAAISTHPEYPHPRS